MAGPGQKPRVSDGDVLDVFRATTDLALGTAEVADALPIGRRATYNRLTSLSEQGLLVSKQIGERNTVWWLAARDYSELDSRADDLAAGGGVSFDEWLAEDA
jgi:hypothetical protein